MSGSPCTDIACSHSDESCDFIIDAKKSPSLFVGILTAAAHTSPVELTGPTEDSFNLDLHHH